jgi:hypothetical protein
LIHLFCYVHVKINIPKSLSEGGSNIHPENPPAITVFVRVPMVSHQWGAIRSFPTSPLPFTAPFSHSSVVTLTAVAANIPIWRRRALKSREGPRRADKNPQIPSWALQFLASRALRLEPAVAAPAAAVGSSHGGDSQVRHVQPAPRYVRVRLSVSATAGLISMPPSRFSPRNLGIFPVCLGLSCRVVFISV